VRGVSDGPLRLPVEEVIRAERRRYAGQLASGRLRVGDEVVVLPSGMRSRVAALEGAAGELDEAAAPDAVAVVLEDELDVGRGDLLAHPETAPEPARRLEAVVRWLGGAPANPGGTYLLLHTTRTVRARLESVDGDGRVQLRTGAEVMADPYSACRATGAFTLLDPATRDAVAAGMVA
jgi:bifunctional enzyme CysN/CysC